MPMTPESRRAHRKNVRDAKAAAALAAAAADNPLDDDELSVDDIAQSPPQRVTPKSKAKPTPRKIDPEIMARAVKLGVVAPRATPKVDPTVKRGISRHPETGRVVVERNGVSYTRLTTNVGDKFYVHPGDIPDGMSYQWIAVTVMGFQQTQSLASFDMNGWRPVPISRYPGRYAPISKKSSDPIIIEGLMLVERPIELTVEARTEEVMEARNLIRTRNEQFNPRLPGALDGRHRGTGLKASRTIEGMPDDVGRPKYQMDVDPDLV